MSFSLDRSKDPQAKWHQGAFGGSTLAESCVDLAGSGGRERVADARREKESREEDKHKPRVMAESK